MSTEVAKAPPSLRVSGVAKAFDATQALDDVSLEVAPGSIHALLGGNGSGKSTLIKILAGVVTADRGTGCTPSEEFDLSSMNPSKAREAGLHFVHQQAATFSTLSVAENFAMGPGFGVGPASRIHWRRLRRETAETLERFGIHASPEQELGELGPATRKMIEIARALKDRDPDQDGVLLLDEPTAALPADEVHRLLDAMRRYAADGWAVVYVTHRLEEVFAVADSATLLRDGLLVGSVDPRTVDQGELVSMMMGSSVEPPERIGEISTAEPLLEVKDLKVGPLQSVSLSVRPGEVVGVAGLIGSGRSTLLKCLFGVMPVESGEVWLEGRENAIGSPAEAIEAGVAYVPEDRPADGVFNDLSVMENVSASVGVLPSFWRKGLMSRRSERAATRELFESYLIKAESENASILSLSGGNQQKVVLARSLRTEPKLLLLDEPTQGVDVRARAEIYELIRRAVAAGAAALVASSDFEELAAICDRVVVLRRGCLVGEVERTGLTPEGLHVIAQSEVVA